MTGNSSSVRKSSGLKSRSKKSVEKPSKISSHEQKDSSNRVPETSPLNSSPLGDFLSPFRPASTQWVARYVFISFALILRLAVGLGPYSGMGQEPLHGDFEAQRHWLEITTNLPMKLWYFHDLEWWGLDYPPVTAYHSWLLGMIAKVIDPKWVELYTSRGLESPGLKAFMRGTALFSELLIYIPAVMWFVRWNCGHRNLSAIYHSIAAAAILFQPALILIDHGHFQYNSVMLGFALLSIVNLQYNNRLMASFFFVLSIGFKQMALYYAPAIFAYLLGSCVFPKINPMRLVYIGTVTIGTFVLIITPLFISGGLPVLQQALIRVFPFNRGLWEDKVANFWCALNTFVKLKNIYTSSELQRFSLIFTLGGIAPGMLITFFYPKKTLLPWSFAVSAWAFFLFSFQVHEKSVLLPLMPTTLLLSTTNDRLTLDLVMWINNVAMFSMYPLLSREGLTLQFWVMTLCWNWLIGNPGLPTNLFWMPVVALSYLGMAGILGGQTFGIATNLVEKFPDLWTVGNVILSCGCFGLFWIWMMYKMIILRNEE